MFELVMFVMTTNSKNIYAKFCNFTEM